MIGSLLRVCAASAALVAVLVGAPLAPARADSCSSTPSLGLSVGTGSTAVGATVADACSPNNGVPIPPDIIQLQICAKANNLDDSDYYAQCKVKAPPEVVELAAAVQKALAKLTIPATEINIGPDPSVNEWNMVAVGEEIWLWSAPATSLDSSVTEDGIAITLTAARTRLVFNMGDGTELTCTSSTPRPPKLMDLIPSPDCGHAYSEPNPAMPISARAIWQVTWSALGYSGVLTFVMTANRTIDVGELRVVYTTQP